MQLMRKEGTAFILQIVALAAILIIAAPCLADTAHKKIAAGENHTIFLKADGTLWAYGDNFYGQLGDGTNIGRNYPVQVGADTDWVAVAAGYQHSFALKTNGTVWSWGSDAEGQLGTIAYPENIDRNVPTQTGSHYNYRAIDAGAYFSVGLKTDGNLYAWGDNSAGQLGDGLGGDGTSNNNSPQAKQIGTGRDWLAVTAGGWHTVALKSDGTLWTWGDNTFSQLGDGSVVANRNEPDQAGEDTDWTQISAGQYHTSAIKAAGSLWAWGSNSYGQLGDGTASSSQDTPVQIGTGQIWTEIASGDSHTIARMADGTFWSWGHNASGQLGDGTNTDTNAPNQVGTEHNWIGIAAGGSHTVASRADGIQWSCGNNADGQLGDGTGGDGLPDNNKSLLVAIGSIDTDWATVDAGVYHAVALQEDGTLWSWGYNGDNQIDGGESTGDQLSPVRVTNDTDWSSVVAGDYFSLALKANGTLWGWGDNTFDQLGYDESQVVVPVQGPKQSGTDTDWVAIDAGTGHAIGLKENGTIWTWGDNASSQLGHGLPPGDPFYVHAQVGLDSDWTAIAAGGTHNIALKADGTLWAWGENDFGQLGDETTITRSTPVKIGTDNDWFAISAGINHTLALKVGSARTILFAWGKNASGQLGEGTTADRLLPVPIGTSYNWRAIKAGADQSFAIQSDGTLWGWGANNAYQLGDDTSFDRNIPTEISTDTDWTDVATGSNFTVGLKSYGSYLWSWGDNFYGQLGYGNTNDVTSTVDTDKDATPDHFDICPDWPAVWNDNHPFSADRGYSTIRKAIYNQYIEYSAPIEIWLLEPSYDEDLVFDLPLDILLTGINDCYMSIPGSGEYARINGSLTVINGTLTVENIIIQ